MTNHITTEWKGGNTFSSNNPTGMEFTIVPSAGDGDGPEGLSPKALMLSSLAGCTGLDVAALIHKMKLEVERFHLEVYGELTEEHPRYYHKVRLEYHFHGTALNEASLQKAVDLSLNKYCGVSEMFRRFAELETRVEFHNA